MSRVKLSSDEVLRFIEANPGCSMRDMTRGLHKGKDAVVRRVSSLVEEGRVSPRSKRGGQARTTYYYPEDFVGSNSNPEKSVRADAVANLMSIRPFITVRELCTELSLHETSVREIVTGMLEEGTAVRYLLPDGRAHGYCYVGEGRALEECVMESALQDLANRLMEIQCTLQSAIDNADWTRIAETEGLPEAIGELVLDCRPHTDDARFYTMCIVDVLRQNRRGLP